MAFYRFRLRRESRRLKVEVAGRMERASGLTGTDDLIYLVVTTTVTKIGDAEVGVDDTLLVLESLDAPPETTRPPWIAGWNDLLSGPVSTWVSRPLRAAGHSSPASPWKTEHSWVFRIPATGPYA